VPQRIVALPPDPNPLIEFAGMFKDDSLFVGWIKAIDE
jgi:hypothetical protein